MSEFRCPLVGISQHPGLEQLWLTTLGSDRIHLWRHCSASSSVLSSRVTSSIGTLILAVLSASSRAFVCHCGPGECALVAADESRWREVRSAGQAPD